MTEGSYFIWELRDRGGAPCVRDDRKSLSYNDFADRVDACAQQLMQLGVRRSDVVATLLPNRAELLIVLMAAWRLGAIATPVNASFTAAEADYQLTDSAAKVVVSDGSLLPQTDRIHLHVDDLAPVPLAGWVAPPTPEHGEDALLIYTSGSTGKPKGVRLSHANLHYMATAMARLLQLTADDHALLVLPLFHVNAICVSFLAPILVGGQLSITGKFSVTRFFDDVVRLRPTYFSAVPTIYALLTAHPPTDRTALSSLRFAICGAAPISKELLDRTQKTFGVPILEGYGLTEGTCASCCNPVDGLRKLGSVGPPIPGQRIRIQGPDGTQMPTGQPCEVLISGPNVMQGYLNRPEANSDTVVGGWLHTGDIGILDEDGYLSIVDRIKDMIIRGGENIYPKEIESALSTHPAVLECAVIGVPDEIYGEVPHAYVVTYPELSVAPGVLAVHLADRLSKVKLPSDIHLVDQLPRNPVGKIDKLSLRRSAAAAHQPS